MDHGYGRERAYARSKLANLLFAAELDRRLRRAGLRVLSVAAHPGMTKTNLAAGGSRLGVGAALNRLVDRMSIALNFLNQNVSAGVQPLLYAALSNQAEGGRYYGPGHLFGLRGQPGPSRQSDAGAHCPRRILRCPPLLGNSTTQVGMVYNRGKLRSVARAWCWGFGLGAASR